MKILITGVGGSGKTTLIKELSKRGDIGIDLDETNLCFWVDNNTKKKSEYTEGAGAEWLENHSWRLDVKSLQELLKNFSSTKNIFIGGKIAKSQLEEVCNLFDKVFLLSPSDSVLSHRQSTRINKENKFAKSEDEQKHILQKRKKFEEECQRMGAILINADEPVKNILEKIN